MPEQRIETDLNQNVDIAVLRKERVPYGTLGSQNAKLESITTFGPSAKADIHPYFRVPPEYVAGSLIGNGKELYIEAGSEDALLNFKILLTPILTNQDAEGETFITHLLRDSVLLDDSVLSDESVLLSPGDKLKLYNLAIVPGQTFSDRCYVAQFGNVVRGQQRGAYKKLLHALPRVEGQLPFYNLIVGLHTIYPNFRLIGLIPEGEASLVVTAEIYDNSIISVGRELKATLGFRVTGEYNLIPQRISELERIAKISEISGENVPVSVYRGNPGEPPEELVRRYIMSELYIRVAKGLIEHMRRFKHRDTGLSNVNTDNITISQIEIILQRGKI